MGKLLIGLLYTQTDIYIYIFINNATLECIAAGLNGSALGFTFLEVKPMHFCKGRRQMVENPKKPKILENRKKIIRKPYRILENHENPKTTIDNPKSRHRSFD